MSIFFITTGRTRTPLEETMGALDQIVRSGKALYAGISNYPADLAQKAIRILRSLGTPCLIHQPKFSMFERWVKSGLLTGTGRKGSAAFAFPPLAQGLLTDRYLKGIPSDSRASKPHGFLRPAQITEPVLGKIRKLNDIAIQRGQTLAQMSLAWILRHPEVTSVLIGASRVSQVEDAVGMLKHLSFDESELKHIESILAS